MLGSAALAVLAVALSSDVAAAQQEAKNYLTLTISYDLPEPPQIENYLALATSYELPEPPAPIEHRLAFSLDPTEHSLVMESGELKISYDVAVVARQRRIALSLYATQGALQVLDLATTSRALAAGHREGNPIFKSGNLSAMAVAKAAVMGFHIYAVERLEKRNPKLAMWVRFGTNAMMSLVVVNNLAVLAH